MFSGSNLLLLAGIVALHGCALFSAGHALLHKRDSRSALGWVALILLMPPAGILFYWIFGIARIDSRAIRLMEQAAGKVIGGLVDLHGKTLHPEPLASVPDTDVPERLQYLLRAGRTITGRLMTGGNHLFPLHNGETAYPAMLDAIANAHTSVYLSSFIFDADTVGKAFAAALQDAAERGCDVRVLLDGVGAYHPFVRWRKLLGPRVKLAFFLPPDLFPPQFSINLRTHRKVLVCDGVTAFTGGMNISRRHLVDPAGFAFAGQHLTPQRTGQVQDLHFRCCGPITQQFEIAFLMDWSFATGSFNQPTLTPVVEQGDSLCRLLMDGPGSPDETIIDLFCAQIASARHSVRVMSPYFLPPPSLAGALTSAALRGVAVSVIVPERGNHLLVQWAMSHQMPMLVEKGVRILTQPPPFAHTKLLLIDDEYTVLGSANLDPRSLNLNFEMVLEVLDHELTASLTAFYDALVQRCTPLSLTPPSLPVRLRNAASWIFSPYL